MEIVINVCFGGFSLSTEAEDMYAAKKGMTLYRYEQTKYRWDAGADEYVKTKAVNESLPRHTFTKDHGDKFSEFPNDDSYWYSGDIKRDDPLLIEVVRQLGKAADGNCAELKIVEIPDDTDYVIEQYDGNEHIAEAHQTWC